MSEYSSSGLPASHPDYELTKRLEGAVLRHAGGIGPFRQGFPPLLRQAVDEVIDAARSNRFTLDEVEKTEKTYLGTKIEIFLRNYLKMQKGKVLDLSIDGIETDIKNTIGGNWTIPLESVGHPCILVSLDEIKALCSFGIVVITDGILNVGRNRDGKRTISKVGFESIHWILRNEPYPENFWQHLAPEIRAKITSPKSGTKRLEFLFRLVQRRPISRVLILGLAQQKDAMKRLRKNGGARDALFREGIALLSGQYDRELIHRLRLPICDGDEFVSTKPESEEDIELLRAAGRIK